MFNLDFGGQTVLITGATRGIGKRLAQDFENQGAELILTGTNRNEILNLNMEAKIRGSNRIYVCADFRDTGCVERLCSKVAAKRVDVLVNNAAWNRNNLLKDASISDFDVIMDINLKTPWLLMRHFGPEMVKRGYGRIVNIASILGSGVSFPGRSAYSAVKAGLIGMTESVALELAPNVLVNAVSPGFVDTEMTRTNLSAEKIAGLERQIPMRRLALTQDISSAVLYLSSVSNTYITGKNLVVDGGYVNT